MKNGSNRLFEKVHASLANSLIRQMRKILGKFYILVILKFKINVHVFFKKIEQRAK